MSVFLLSNDDGVEALGIHYLHEALQTLGEVYVVAPDRDRSGASQSLTLHRPSRVHRKEKKRMAVEGSPADCVHLALSGLMPLRPDWVISGINHDANMGSDVLYSGTVAAALEGSSSGVPSVAFSLAGKRHYDTAMMVAKILLPQLMPIGLPDGMVLNINVPDRPFSALKGLRWTRLGQRESNEQLIPVDDPRGGERYWIGLPGIASNTQVGSDFHAVLGGYVSATLLHVDRSILSGMDERWAALQCIALSEEGEV